MNTDPISTRYLMLALELDRQIEGLVDAYIGVPELRASVLAQPLRPAAEIADDLVALHCELHQSNYPVRRKAYLAAQLRALIALARKQAGEVLSYCEEVRTCFDIEPHFIDESLFEEANAQLDALLPRPTPDASLSARYAAWRSQFIIAPDGAMRLIERIAYEARTRTAALLDLPEGEGVQFVLVNDQSWIGYNWYLGNAQSRVEINTDLPIYATSLLDLVCHEAYPGHHTEHALKEHHLYHTQGWGEHAIQLINTPECVIAEGIATLAAEMIFGYDDSPTGDSVAWAAAELYPLAGIHLSSAAQAELRQINTARRHLRALDSNAALLLHERGASEADVLAYLLRYAAGTLDEARQRLRFIRHPLWRTYIFTYASGYDLLKRWIGNRPERFVTLLTEQITPGWVEQQILAEAQLCLRD